MILMYSLFVSSFTFYIFFFFFLRTGPPRNSPLFPSPPLSRSQFGGRVRRGPPAPTPGGAAALVPPLVQRLDRHSQDGRHLLRPQEPLRHRRRLPPFLNPN